MGLAFEQAKDEIKRRTSLVQLLGEYVTLKKKGRDHVGLCPFHGERSPSLHVHDAEGYYYCFGCQARGDHYTFLMEHVGYSFIEAVKLLSERCGVELPDQDESPEQRERRQRRKAKKERYVEVNERAQAVFARQLSDPENVDGLQYLRRRGLTDETIERFALGYAPESWDRLATALERGGFDTMRAAADVGLIGQRREGRGHYDKFRHRVIFPLREPLRGQVIAFAGRTLSAEKDVPKYVNSSESELFTKGRCLYGLFEAKKDIRDTGKAIVVEGQVDVLTLQQSGFSAIAPMGTALTQDQCDLLKRFADHVILVYDGDSAGRAAAVKAVPLVLNAGLNGTVVLLPDGEDPDTLVRQQGPGALQALIERGKPLFEAYLEDAVATHDDPAAVFERVRPVLALLPTEFDREQGRKRTAELLGTLNSEAARYLRVTPTPAASAPLTQTIPQRKAPAPERELLGILLQHPELIPFWRQRSDDALTHHTISDVVEQMVAIHDRLGRFDMLELMEWLTARGMERFVPHLMRLQQKQLYPDGWQSAFVEIADHLEAEAQKRRERAELVESVRNRDWSKSEESQHEHP